MGKSGKSWFSYYSDRIWLWLFPEKMAGSLSGYELAPLAKKRMIKLIIISSIMCTHHSLMLSLASLTPRLYENEST